MDFTKFVSLIESQKFYFSRADKLGDPFEGSWPIKNVEAWSEIPDEIAAEKGSDYRSAMNKLTPALEAMPRFVAVSCWHLNPNESAAMWKFI